MKRFRPIIMVTLLSLSGMSVYLFTNFTSPTSSYETPYLSGSGTPVSEVLLETPGPVLQKSLVIAANEVLYLDQNLEVDELIINGQLHCDQDMAEDNIEIKARVIYVNGLFQCGQKSAPYTKKLTISLKPGNVNPNFSPAYRGLVVNNGGRLILTGSRKKTNWMRLSQTASAGQNYIFVDQAVDVKPNVWSVGDQIAIGPTSFRPSEAESFTITGIQGNKIFLSGNLLYSHLGEKEIYNTTYNGQIQLEQRAEVANLTRNILIRADESVATISTNAAVGSELGGHVMVMFGGKAFVDSVEFYHMGQAGIMARYPFHWHMVDNGQGQFIQNSSIHHSFQRCITIHDTNNVLVNNNVCYDFKGHGFFLEDGEEINNTLSNNLGIKSNYPYPAKALLASDQQYGGESQGRFPNVSVFWISHPKNSIFNNVASGSVGSGFWMAFENQVKNEQGIIVGHPILENTTKFESNISHSAQVGFTWDGAPGWESANNPNNPEDKKLEPVYYHPSDIPQFKRLTSFKNKLSGFYFRGYTAVFDGNISADNGWHYWLAYNQIVKNSVIIGRSSHFSSADQTKALENTRNDRYMPFGIVQYDGPFELNGVDFINYPTQKLYHTNNLEVTPVPIGTTGGTERLTNASQRVSFNPNPIHRLHMQSETSLNTLGVSGNASIRDADGTLTGMAGGILVGKTSLGVHPLSQCVDGGTSFYTFKKCPPSYKESELHLFDGDGNTNPWAMPFVMRRSDGALSHPMSQWADVLGIGTWRKGGNKMALANTMSLEYQLMMKNLKNFRLWVTSEIPNPVIPVTKVVGQGRNCSLTNIPAVNSLTALKSSTTSAYFSVGEDLYFRLIPRVIYEFITPNNGHGSALSYKSESTNLVCGSIPTPAIKGYVDGVVRQMATGQVKVWGWACNYSKDQQIDVQLKLKDPIGNIPANLIQTVRANLTSEAAVAFECGVPNTTAFRYEFLVPSTIAKMYQGKKVHVVGVSTTGGANLELNQSGLFTMPIFEKTVPLEQIGY